jgi:hypothetical protein
MAVAVIVTGPPAVSAVTRPVLFTLATELLFEVHITPGFVELAGVIVAVS